MEGRFDIHADNKIASPELNYQMPLKSFGRNLKLQGVNQSITTRNEDDGHRRDCEKVRLSHVRLLGGILISASEVQTRWMAHRTHDHRCHRSMLVQK